MKISNNGYISIYEKPITWVIYSVFDESEKLVIAFVYYLN